MIWQIQISFRIFFCSAGEREMSVLIKFASINSPSLSICLSLPRFAMLFPSADSIVREWLFNFFDCRFSFRHLSYWKNIFICILHVLEKQDRRLDIRLTASESQIQPNEQSYERAQCTVSGSTKKNVNLFCAAVAHSEH